MAQTFQFCTCTTESFTPSISRQKGRFRIMHRTGSSPRVVESPRASSVLTTENRLKTLKNDSSSIFKESWARFNHKPKIECSVGMERKPLVPYDPNHDRNRLPVMLKGSKGRSPTKNTFDNFEMIKNRTIIRNTFQTMYQKSFKHPEVLRRLKLKQQMIQ